MFVKIRDFIKFEGFSCGIPREQAILRKSKTPRKSPEKRTFLSLAFTMHLVWTLLKKKVHKKLQKFLGLVRGGFRMRHFFLGIFSFVPPREPLA